MSADQKPEAQAVAWMARYGMNKQRVYVTTIHELAVENDARKSPEPLFDRATLDAAIAEAVAAERALWQADAERYRWLRDRAQTSAVIRWKAPSDTDAWTCSEHEHELPFTELAGFNAPALDAAIDAAIRTAQERT